MNTGGLSSLLRVGCPVALFRSFKEQAPKEPEGARRVFTGRLAIVQRLLTVPTVDGQGPSYSEVADSGRPQRPTTPSASLLHGYVPRRGRAAVVAFLPACTGAISDPILTATYSVSRVACVVCMTL